MLPRTCKSHCVVLVRNYENNEKFKSYQKGHIVDRNVFVPNDKFRSKTRIVFNFHDNKSRVFCGFFCWLFGCCVFEFFNSFFNRFAFGGTSHPGG